ncbi:MAG: ABC transporter permease subunit [Euryarchaeota archaeon]|jgi:ABC-2 type transport system permease protein|nr:ABC transporter permease subunit [Euryarchaeota archaeon]
MMDIRVIKAIYKKDLKEILSLTTVKYSFIFFPVVFLFIMLIVIYFTYNSLIAQGSIQNAASAAKNLEIFSYISTSYLIFFGIIPLSLASTISSYSIVGEKTQRTIEPILATPVEDSELFIGKMLAPFVPTIIITYIVLGFYTLFVDYLSLRLGGIVFPNYAWYSIVILFIPFSTILMILLTLVFSSRAMDPRSAQQFSSIILIPLLIIFILGIVIYTLTSLLIVIMSIIVILSDIVVYKFALKIFNREIIVSRWK